MNLAPGDGRAGSASLRLILAFLFYAVLWMLVTLDLPHQDARWEALVPGALLFAVGLVVPCTCRGLYILTPYVLNKGGTYGAARDRRRPAVQPLPGQPADDRLGRCERHALEAWAGAGPK